MHKNKEVVQNKLALIRKYATIDQQNNKLKAYTYFIQNQKVKE